MAGADPPKIADLCSGPGPHKMAGPCSGAGFTEAIKSQNRTDKLSQRTRTTELAQLKRDVQNFPFPLSSITLDANTNMSMFPLREVSVCGTQEGVKFVNVLLNSVEEREFKREMSTILEDPLGLGEQLDQFLGSTIYIWEEMQFILGVLFTPEGRQIIRIAGIKIRERKNPLDVQGEYLVNRNSPSKT